MSICFHKDAHSGGHCSSHLFHKKVTSVKITLSPKVSFGISFSSNLNRILMRVFENVPGAQSICFYKEALSGGHYFSCFSDKQVTSVNIVLSSN